jgi:hypothetical protein
MVFWVVIHLNAVWFGETPVFLEEHTASDYRVEE